MIPIWFISRGSWKHLINYVAVQYIRISCDSQLLLYITKKTNGDCWGSLDIQIVLHVYMLCFVKAPEFLGKLISSDLIHTTPLDSSHKVFYNKTMMLHCTTFGAHVNVSNLLWFIALK